jgi:ferrous iron transport protein A
LLHIPMIDAIPLTMLRRGEVANVQQLVGAPESVRRLHELGVRSGALIEIVRGGSPCIIRIEGTTLCFRDDEQVKVLVSPRKTA